MGATMRNANGSWLGWVLLVTAAGCASVIGADDYKVAAQGGGGAAGHGGVSGMGGISGIGGRGGTGGTTGGYGGTGAIGGTGGGTGGTTVAPCTAPVTPAANVVRACLLWVGCNPLYPDVTVSGCITYNTPGAFAGNACIASALDCNAIQSCVGAGYVTSECTGRTAGPYCVGAKAVHCDSATSGWYLDFTKRGGTCATYTGSDGTATVGCRVVASCSDPSGDMWCDFSTATNDPIYECINGVGYGRYCSSFGGECFFSGTNAGCYHTGGTYCVPPGDPLAVGGTVTKPSCSGAKATACGDNYSTMSFDCSASNLSCVVGTTDGYCLAPGCTTAQSDACKESCDATTGIATFCVGGAPYKVNCKTYGYGFTKCAQYTSTTLGAFVTCEL
jgi:hypothetical protein